MYIQLDNDIDKTIKDRATNDCNIERQSISLSLSSLSVCLFCLVGLDFLMISPPAVCETVNGLFQFVIGKSTIGFGELQAFDWSG